MKPDNLYLQSYNIDTCTIIYNIHIYRTYLTCPIVNLMELSTCQLKLILAITSVHNPHRTILDWSQFQMLKWAKTESCTFFLSEHTSKCSVSVTIEIRCRNIFFFLQISRDAFVLVCCCQLQYHDSLSSWSVHQVHQVKFTVYQYTMHHRKEAAPKLLL